MSIGRKWSRSMVASALVFALGVFLLLALVSFQRDHYDHPEKYPNLPTTFYSLSKALFSNLGGSAYFLVMISLAWSVIVFFRERSRELLPKAGGLAVLVCAAATLFALWGSDDLGGHLGAGIAGLLESFPGAVVGSILVSVVFVISFIVATDWLFYSALREAVTGSDLLADEKAPVPLPSPYDEEHVIASEEEIGADDDVEEEEPEEEREGTSVGPDEAPEVPEGLRKILGHGHRDIEIEETGVELAEEEEEDESAALSPVASVASAPEEEVLEEKEELETEEEEEEKEEAEASVGEGEDESEIRMPIGQRGHEIAVHMPDVEFAEEEMEESAAEFVPDAPVVPPSAVFETEDVLVSEAVAVPSDDEMGVSGATDEEIAEAGDVIALDAPEQAMPEESPPDEPEEQDSPFAGVVLEDEVMEWGSPVIDEELEPDVEAEPTSESEPIVETEPEEEDEPEEARTDAPADEIDSSLPGRTSADDKFDNVLDTLLGQESPTEPSEAIEETPSEVDLPAPEEPVAPTVLETPDSDAPAREGLVGWFRRNKPTEADATAAGEAPKRSRRRVSETPDLFDPEPTEPDAKLIDEAALLVIDLGRASVVLIQRRLGIGYDRARKLVARLVDLGVLGPMAETGSHPVLMTEEAWRKKQSPTA